MKVLLSILFLQFSFGTILLSQESQVYDFDHVYIHITGDEPEEYHTEFGRIIYDEEGTPRKVAFENNTIQEFILVVEESIDFLPEAKSNILTYIHGMWGHTSSYLEYNTTEMAGDIYAHPDSHFGLIVSLIWDSKLIYGTNVAIARDKGVLFGEYFNLLFYHIGLDNFEDKNRMSFICHSMGNRVFESMYTSFLEPELSIDFFKTIVFAAADLESDIFNENQPLSSLPDAAEQIVVYTHNNDRSLKMSKLLNDNNRLGLDGIDNLDKLPDDIYIVNTSLLNDDEDRASRFSNHRYFFSSPTVRRDILNLFNYNLASDIPNRKPMNREREYKLLFAEQ